MVFYMALSATCWLLESVRVCLVENDSLPPLIDIGANLADNAFSHDQHEVISRAKQSGISAIIVTGSDYASSARAIKLAEQYRSYLYSTVGIHPHHARDYQSSLYATLQTLSNHHCVKAIGEAGLDFYRNISSKEQQIAALEAQLELAIETQLPLFLHERDAFAMQIDIISRYRDPLKDAVIHCFTGTKDQAFRYLDLDLYIGITGWICDERRGKHLHDFIADIPLNRLMIETDAPYLMPRVKPRPQLPSRQRNEPCTLPYVLHTIAAHRSEDLITIANATTDNAKRFFAL